MHGTKISSLLRVLTIVSLFAGSSFCTQDIVFHTIDNALVPVLDTQGMTWRDDWHYITYLFLNEINNQLCFRTYPFTTITTGGFYTLATNVANQITITVPNVTLDMNGCTANGIVINSGLSNVMIRNGTVNAVTDGILVNAGCNNIIVKDITAKNCLRGITFDRVTNGIMSHCDLVLNTTGLHIDTSHNIYIEDCTAHANKQAGFSLLASTTCTLTNCYAISTGDGNTSLAGDTSNVFGFVSSNGYGTIFERCIANSTQALTATAPETIVAGFGLRGTERCSKIISSEAGNSMTSPNGFTIPYGMWLENTFDGLVSVTSINVDTGAGGATVWSAQWSPDGQYIALGGVLSGTSGNDLFIYKFDRNNNALIRIAALNPNSGSLSDTVRAVRWSADGTYVAVGGSISGTTNHDLFVYRFDRANETVTEIIAINPDEGGTADTVRALAWSPDDAYLAVGGAISGTTNNDLFIYRFNKVKETLLPVATTNPDGTTAGTITTIAWSPDGTYLAVGGAVTGVTGNDLFIYKFNRSTEALSLVTSVNPDGGSTGDSVETVAWSPDGIYLAVGGTIVGGTNNDLFVYRFNRTTETLQQIISVNPDEGSTDDVFSVDWLANGTYLAVGGSINGATNNDLFIYQFNRGIEQLIQRATANPSGGGQVNSVAWSPDGIYLLVGSTLGGATNDNLLIYKPFHFPQGNVISNNTVYCDAGSSSPGGVGISGSSIENLIIGNVAYSNPITPAIVSSNYQFVCNVFNPLFGDEPTALQNIALSSKTPLPSRFDIPAALNRLEVLAESLVDNLL